MRECLFYWYSVFCLFWHVFFTYIVHLTQSVKKLYTGNEEFYSNIQKVYNGNGDEFRRPCPCLYGIYACIGYVSQWLCSQGLLEMQFAFGQHLPLVLFSAAIAVVVGLAAGIYPSFYVTSLRERLGALPEVEDVASVVDICRLIWCCTAAYPPYCGLPVLEGGNS